MVISGFNKDLHVEDLHVGSVQRELSDMVTFKLVPKEKLVSVSSIMFGLMIIEQAG